MSIDHYHINDIDIYIGGYDDISIESLSAQQQADIASIKSEKQRRERELIYSLINHCATKGTGNFAYLNGATLGHYSNGAPFIDLKSGVGKSVFISLSHCRIGACIAISDTARDFGIDIEEESEKLQRVKEKFINESESEFIGKSQLLLSWTIKEAVYKAAGISGLPLRDGIQIKHLTNSSDPTVVKSGIIVGEQNYEGWSIVEGRTSATLCYKMSV